jgi:hypothetical protein
VNLAAVPGGRYVDRRDWLLGFAAAAPPLLWAATLLLGYYANDFSCETGSYGRATLWGANSDAVILVIVVVAGVLTVLAMIAGYGRWRATRGDADEGLATDSSVQTSGEAVASSDAADAIGIVRTERRHFMAGVSLISGFVFLLMIVLSGVQLLWFGGCR